MRLWNPEAPDSSRLFAFRVLAVSESTRDACQGPFIARGERARAFTSLGREGFSAIYMVPAFISNLLPKQTRNNVHRTPQIPINTKRGRHFFLLGGVPYIYIYCMYIYIYSSETFMIATGPKSFMQVHCSKQKRNQIIDPLCSDLSGKRPKGSWALSGQWRSRRAEMESWVSLLIPKH